MYTNDLMHYGVGAIAEIISAKQITLWKMFFYSLMQGVYRTGSTT